MYFTSLSSLSLVDIPDNCRWLNKKAGPVVQLVERWTPCGESMRLS